MGKTIDSAHKRYKNVRVDPGSLAHYMCYYCGKMSIDRLEYQQHMLKVHEVMSQSYQLWSDHTMDTLGLRWSRSKPTDNSRSASPRSAVSKVRDSEDDDEDYVYEMEERPAKRRKKEEEKAKNSKKKNDEARRKMEAEAKRRKRVEEKKKEEARKAEELRKEQEKAAALTAAALVVEKQEVLEEVKVEPEIEKKPDVAPPSPPPPPPPPPPMPEKRKRRRTDRRKEERSNEGDKLEVTALVKKILEESKKKEASSQEVEDEDVFDVEKSRKPLEATSKTTRYCKVCKKGLHYNFASLFEHYIDHHHAVLKAFHYYGYRGKELLGRKLLLQRDFCQRCCMTFSTAKEYYVHMIHNHIVESVRGQISFENATSADVEAKMEFRERIITCGYNFKFADTDQTFEATEPAISTDDSQQDTEEDTSLLQEPVLAAEIKKEEASTSKADLTNR